MGCLKIDTEEKRKIVVATLKGDVAAMSDILSSSSAPVDVAYWCGERRGVSSEGTLNSFQLAQAMNDALRNDKLYKPLNVEAMWHLHKEMFPNIKRTLYEQLGFIIWNWMDEPGDNPYFDEDDEQELVKSGVNLKDIQLTNAGIQHMENELVTLLKDGASPYFLVTIPDLTEAHIDDTGHLRHTYFDVAPMLEVTKVHSDDYWFEFIGDYLEKDISSLTLSSLELVVEGLFNVGACERILHLTDRYITEKARLEGNRLMFEQLGKIHSITT